MENKYCLTCLAEGNIVSCPDGCNDESHRTLYKKKEGYNKQLNDLIDIKLNETLNMLDMFFKMMKK